MEEPTILEKSLHAIAAETGMDTLNVQTLESALEATGASAKLRAMTNEEAKRDALERSMYELAEIPAGVMGHLKRTVWSYPNHDSGMKYYKAKSVLKDAKEPYPLWKTQTGRFCFTSGLCRLAVHFDPFLEGTRSEVCHLLSL